MQFLLRSFLTLLFFLLSVNTVSADQTYTFDLPTQPLATTLNNLADISGAKLMYADDAVQNLLSIPLNGTYTVVQKLDQILDKNQLSYELVDNSMIVIKQKAPDPTQFPEVKVTGYVDEDAPGNSSYTRTQSSTAAKTNLPIMKTPISVQVVPRAVLEDQQAVQIEDAVKNVSGVSPGFTFGGLSEEFMIRGFNTDFLSYRDGFRFPAARLSLANIERIEVVKGAAANLYGRIEPGGMINLITKRPQAQRYYSLNQQFGSYGQYQTRADATGALNESGTLLYRLNVEYLNKNSFRDFGFHERIFVAPSLTWKITPSTQFDVDFTYSDEDFQEDHGIVAVGSRPAKVPRSRYLGEPTDRATLQLYNTAATLTHAFNDNWQVRSRFNHLRRDTSDPQTVGNNLNELTGELQRGFYQGDSTSDTFMGTVDVTGRFNTAGIEHNVLAGCDYYGSFGKTSSISTSAGSINIFQPRYNNVNLSLQPHNFFIDSKNEWNGVYFQDQITLFEKLHIMGGGRYDWASRDIGTAFGVDKSLADAGAASNTVNNSRFSPRAGIVYQPWEWLSFFGNYVQSLGAANTAFDATGNTLAPQIGEQFEGGFKTSLFDGRLNSNVAYYHLTKSNLSLQVPGQPFSIAVGEARSQGVEVDVSGQITNGLSLIMTYAYTDAEVTKGANQGNRLWNVPKQSGSLWARYDIQNESLRGLSVGAGIYAQGRRPGDPENTFYLPSQARVDAMVRYQPKFMNSRLSLQLNAYNLANSTLYGGTAGNRNNINVGLPRMFIGSIRYTM